MHKASEGHGPKGQARELMKVSVLVRLKPEVLDPQGDAVRRALGTLGFAGVRDVRVGKVIELELEGGSSAELRAQIASMAEQILVNPVIEDFEVQFEQ